MIVTNHGLQVTCISLIAFKSLLDDDWCGCATVWRAFCSITPLTNLCTFLRNSKVSIRIALRRKRLAKVWTKQAFSASAPLPKLKSPLYNSPSTAVDYTWEILVIPSDVPLHLIAAEQFRPSRVLSVLHLFTRRPLDETVSNCIALSENFEVIDRWKRY